MSKASFKKIVMWRVAGAITSMVLIGSIFLVGGNVQDVRRGLLSKQRSLEVSLKAAVYQAMLHDQLVEREADIIRIESMTPSQDEIGSIITTFEQEAQRFGVTMKIPTIEEEAVLDNNGNEVKDQTGLTKAVRMQIQAQGEPAALINFMHAIEHLPWLLGTVSFTFDSDSNLSANQPVVAVPGSNSPPGVKSEPEKLQNGILKMEVKLTILSEPNI